MDPDVARVFAELEPSPGWGDDPVALRESFRGLAPVARRDGRVEVTDRTVPGGDAQPLPVRIYRPAGSDGPVPGAVWFHGGAFLFGDVDVEDVVCYRVCLRLGIVVVSVDYRLAPEHPFPAAADDAYAALRWTADSADELGVDPSRLAVGGHSSGGGLAAATALRARDLGGPALAFQYLGYPALDDRVDTPSAHEVTDVRAWNRRDDLLMWQAYLAGQEATPYAAPARAQDLSGLPPAYVWTPQHDPLRDEAIDYAARLARAGVPTELHLVPGAFHGSEGFAPEAALSRRTVEAWLTALAAALGVPVLDGEPEVVVRA